MKYDIAIIWGWPAGCSCAIMLQEYGYNVAVFERDIFPKHNIWESLLPIVNSDYMKVIWLDEKIIFDDINNYYKLAKYWYSHNKSMDSWFWQAKSTLGYEVSNKYNKRAFTFLASGWYYTKKNFDNFNEVRIENFAYNFEDIDEINHLINIDNNQINFIELFKNIYKQWGTKQYEESIKLLWLQVKILEKKILNIDENLWGLLSYWIKNLSKIQLFQFIFSPNIFSVFMSISEGDKSWINSMINSLIVEFLFQYSYNNQQFLSSKIDIQCSVKKSNKLNNWSVLTLLEDVKHVEISNNIFLWNNKIIDKKEIIYNLDNFIW